MNEFILYAALTGHISIMLYYLHDAEIPWIVTYLTGFIWWLFHIQDIYYLRKWRKYNEA